MLRFKLVMAASSVRTSAKIALLVGACIAAACSPATSQHPRVAPARPEQTNAASPSPRSVVVPEAGPPPAAAAEVENARGRCTSAGGPLEDLALDPRCEIPIDGAAFRSPDVVVVLSDAIYDVRSSQEATVQVELRSSTDVPTNVELDVVGGVILLTATATDAKNVTRTLQGSFLLPIPLPARSFRVRVSLTAHASLTARVALGTLVSTGRILPGGCTCTRGLCAMNVAQDERVPLARGLHAIALTAPFATASSGKGFQLRVR